MALLEPAAGSAPGEPLQLEGLGPMVPPEEDRVLKSKSQQKVPAAGAAKIDAKWRARAGRSGSGC